MKVINALIVWSALCHVTVMSAENYPTRSDALWVTVPDHSDWVYEVGEEAVIEIQLYQYGVPVNGIIRYSIGDDMLPDDTTGSIELKNGKVSLNIGTMKKPGFRDLRLEADLNGNLTKHHIKVGFSPDKLVAYTQEPEDFDTFWSEALNEDAKMPLEYTLEDAPEYTTDRMTCQLVKMKVTPDGRQMYAYLFIPRGDGKFPAVFCPPGAGVKTIKDPLAHRYYGEGGMIRMESEIHGCDPRLSEEEFAQLRKKWGNYLDMGLDSPDNYYMKAVYLGCRRFLDLLTSLPQYDGINLFTQGGSQGGALAITTAALDPRVKGCVSNHPALSDMNGYLGDKTGGYPHHFRKDKSEATTDAIKTLEYYDVVNFAKRLKCPVRMTWGFNDVTCPPTTSYEVWNVIKSPKDKLVTPINEHWTTVNTERGHYEWIKDHVCPIR